MTVPGVRDPRGGMVANTLYSSAGLYADYGALLLASIVVARRLGPEQYGTYALLMWMTSLGVALANNGLTTGVMKFLGEARGRADPQLAGRVLGHFERLQLYSVSATCAVAAVVIVAGSGRLLTHPQGSRLLWALLPAVALRALYLYYFAAARGFEDFRLTAQVQALLAPLTLVVFITAGQLGAGVYGFVCVYSGASLLYALVMRLALHRTVARAPACALDATLLGRIRRHVLYASAIVVLELIVLRQTELFFLGRYSTPENVAYYGLGRSLAASAMLLVPGVFTALLVPVMARTFGKDPALLGRRFLSMTRHILMLAVPVVVLCEVFAADIVSVVYGSAYAPAVLVLRVSVAASAVGVISASASSYQLGADRQRAVVAIMAAVAGLTLVLDYWLIRVYELNGAIAAGAAGSVLLSFGLLWHASRTLGVTIEMGRCIRVIAAGAASALPAVLARQLLPLWLALPAGAALLLLAYSGLTFQFRAWTGDDLRMLHAAVTGLPSWAREPVASLLFWVQRAGTPISDETGGAGRR